MQWRLVSFQQPLEKMGQMRASVLQVFTPPVFSSITLHSLVSSLASSHELFSQVMQNLSGHRYWQGNESLRTLLGCQLSKVLIDLK